MTRNAANAGDALASSLLECLHVAPATASQLSALTGRSAATIARRMGSLAEAGYVQSFRRRRSLFFILAGDRTSRLATRDPWQDWPSPLPDGAKPVARCRHCHDHLAGRVGVALFHGLLRKRALLDPGQPKAKGNGAKTPVSLGAEASVVFGDVGIDLEAVEQRPARFAFACLDWTERRAHLGGALGRAAYDRFRELDWIRPESHTRVVHVTPQGREGMEHWLDQPLALA
ncbi:MAG: winged helix-turn-helix domain-containing protein [Dehalococcoidia bacterium]